MRVHFLDIGQGAATLIEFPCGAMLVDTGGEENDVFHSNVELKAYLDAFFDRRKDLNKTLDVLLLTHPHIDHIRGIPTVLANYKVKNVVDNGQTPREPEEAVTIIRDFRSWVETNKVPYMAVTTADFPVSGSPISNAMIDPFSMCINTDPSVRVLWGRSISDPGWGDDGFGHDEFDDENNHSVVTRFDFGKSSMLITGDLEKPAIASMLGARNASFLDVNIYQVGHHGSHNGTTPELLSAMSPEWAVMEMGPADRHVPWSAYQYGHPREITVNLLSEAISRAAPAREVQVGTAQKQFREVSLNKAIYGTGWDGSVVLIADERGMIWRGSPDYLRAP